MPRRVGLLHVRTFVEQMVKTCDEMLERDGKYENGLRLAPIDQDHLREMRLIGKMILRKHQRKNTRKDIYVERDSTNNKLAEGMVK